MRASADLLSIYDEWRGTESLFSRIKKWADITPDSLAVHAPDRDITYRELYDEVCHVSAFLSDLAPGDRVALLSLRASADYVVLLCGCLATGVVAVPVPTQQRTQLAQLAQTVSATVIFTDDPDQAATDIVGVDRTVLAQTNAGKWPSEFTSDDWLWTPTDPNDACLIALTSGTTGFPKGAFHTWNTLHSLIKYVALGANLGRNVLCAASPMQGTGLLFGVLGPLMHGGAAIIPDGLDAASLAETLNDTSAEVLIAVPALLARLVESSAEVPKLDVTVWGGAPLSRDIEGSLTGRLGVTLLGICGAMDAGQYGLQRLEAGSAAGEPTGYTWSPVAEYRLRSQLTETVDGHLVTVGELDVRGPSCPIGTCAYPSDGGGPTLTTRGAKDWISTGDLVEISEDGSFILKGRTKDVVNRGGYKVPAGSVERTLLQIPGVLDAAVVPVADTSLGERIGAILLLHAGAVLTTDLMWESLTSLKLPRAHWPEIVDVVEEMPRSAGGKADKTVLRSWVESGYPRSVTNTRVFDRRG